MIHHDSFTHPINTPFIYKSQLNSDLIWRYFENVVQSKKNNPHFMTSEAHKILVSFKIANVLTGSGRPATVPRPNRAPAGGQRATVFEDKGVFKDLSNTYHARSMREYRQKLKQFPVQTPTIISTDEFQDFLRRKSKTVINIKNKDNFCLIRTCLLAIYHYNNDENKDKYQTKKLKEFDEMV